MIRVFIDALAGGGKLDRSLQSVGVAMEDYVLDPALEFAPVSRDCWMGSYNAIVSRLQLFVDGHGGEDDLLTTSGELSGVAVEC